MSHPSSITYHRNISRICLIEGSDPHVFFCVLRSKFWNRNKTKVNMGHFLEHTVVANISVAS